MWSQTLVHLALASVAISTNVELTAKVIHKVALSLMRESIYADKCSQYGDLTPGATDTRIGVYQD